MSEKNLKIKEVKIANRENTRLIELAKTNAGISKANVLNYNKRIKQEKLMHEKRLKELQDRLNRAIDNTKRHHDTIDSLIKNKEGLHDQLKEAIHLGEVQCEWCLNWFTQQGFSRHKTSCVMNPGKKAVKDNEKAIKQKLADLAAEKAALQKEEEEILKEIKKV
jgi:hypothetical protein